MKRLFKIVLLCVLVLTLTLLVVGCEEEEKTFGVKGIVTVNGEALAGVTVHCDTLDTEVQTNENGEYSFTGLKGASLISVSKENYDFLVSKKSVSKETTDLNFDALEQFSVLGEVTYDGEKIANAYIVAKSETCNKQTTTNEMGEFSLTGLSGEVIISVSHDNFEFLDKKITIADKDNKVIFTGRYEVFGNITFNGKALEGVVVTDGVNEAVTDSEGNYILKNISANSEIIAKKDGYYLSCSNGSAICDVENKEINFIAYEKYNTSVTLKNLGEVFTSDTNIKLVLSGTEEFNKDLERVIALGTENIFTDIFGNAKIVVKKNNVVLAEGDIEAKQTDLTLDIKNTVKGVVKNELGEAVAGVNVTLNGTEQTTTTNTNGEFIFENVISTNEVEVVKENYIIEQVSVTENNFVTIYEFKANAVYDITGKVMSEGNPLAGAEVKYGSKTIPTDANGEFKIENVNGSVELEIKKEGFESKTIIANSKNNNLEIELDKLYNVTGSVKSGEIALENASIYVNNILKTTTNANGEFTINGLVKENTIKVIKNGYEILTKTVNSQDSEANFNLGYNVTIIARTDTTKVQNAEIWYTDFENEIEKEEVAENGQITLKLYGTSKIRVKKQDKYNFFILDADGNKQTEITITAPQEKAVEFDSTYSLAISVWKEEADGERLVGVNIIVQNEDGKELKNGETTSTSEPFIVEGLKGDTYIQAFKQDGKPYMPRLVSFRSNMSNDIYFYDNAYEISGCITSGGIGVEGVNVTLTNAQKPVTVTTDRDGKYHFPVLKGNYELSLSKAGYKFTYDGKDASVEKPNITMADNGKQFNFEATYDATIVVKSGDKVLSGAKVFVNDIEYISNDYGKVELKDLSGVNNIRVELDGFEFAETTLSGAGEKEIQGTYRVSGVVMSGSTALENVIVQVVGGETYYTDANGNFEITGLKGTNKLTFGLTGYTFDKNNISVDSLLEGLVVDSTYEVRGKVVSGNVNVAGVKVKSGSNEANTTNDGKFTLKGLKGEVTLNFSKDGYDFGSSSTMQVTGYIDNIAINSTYKINGTISSGNIPLANAKVIVNDKTQEADSKGEFEITGLSGRNTITFEKAGYEIKPQEVTGYGVLSIADASYTVIGNVKNGSGKLNGANVIIGGKSKLTDNDGHFEINGVIGTQDIVVSKGGYTFDRATANGYSESTVEIDSTYTVSKQVLYNGTAVKGVNVKYSGSEITENTVLTDNNGKFEIGGLKGSVKIEFSLEEYTFDCGGKSSYFIVANPDDITSKVIGVTWECFYVTGTVKFDSMTLPNIEVTLNGKKVKTNENGEFKFLDEYFKTNQTVTAKLNGATATGIAEKQYDGAVTLTFENNQANQISVLNNAYEYLKIANFKMEMNGNVSASAAGVDAPQKNRKVVEQDSNGTMHYQYANWGNPVGTFGVNVNPQAGQENYVTSKNGKITQIKERNTGFGWRDGYGGFVSQSTVTVLKWANDNFSDVTSSYLSTYGVEINNHSRYIINSSTIDSISYSGGTFNVSFNESATVNLKKQMKKYSGQDIIEFSRRDASFTFNAQGKLASVTVNETYHVKQVVDVWPESTMTETYTYGNVGTITMP